MPIEGNIVNAAGVAGFDGCEITLRRDAGAVDCKTRACHGLMYKYYSKHAKNTLHTDISPTED